MYNAILACWIGVLICKIMQDTNLKSLEWEIWKDINGYEWMYSVSNLGNVFSHISNKKLKYWKHTCGYYIVDLYRDKKKQHYFIHRLVAIHFIENPLNKREVNHINGIKTENNITNLEWCTSSENKIHSYATWIRTASRAKRKNLRQVLQVKNWIIINKYRCVNDATEYTWINNISACCLGKIKTAWWYKWEYI